MNPCLLFHQRRIFDPQKPRSEAIHVCDDILNDGVAHAAQFENVECPPQSSIQRSDVGLLQSLQYVENLTVQLLEGRACVSL